MTIIGKMGRSTLEGTMERDAAKCKLGTKI